MADLSFDADINTSLHKNVQDNLTLSVGDVTGGAIATVTDFAASVWNGLPLTPEVKTTDLLKDINSDALRVYQKAPELIQAASFIGGSVVPMGLAVKGMTALRAGTKGMDWFSAAGKTASIEAATAQFAASGSETIAYRNMLRSIYTKSAVNQAIDAVAMEAALVATFHAHPLMEDYMAEPAKNFAIGAAFGGVLGGAIGVFADRALLREAISPVAEGVLNNTVGKMIASLPSQTNATNLAIHEINVKNLTNIMESLAKNGKNEVNDFTYATADALKKRTIVQQNELFEEMISPELRNLPAAEKKELFEKIVNSNGMLGVENIRFLTAKDLEVEGLIKAPKSLLTDSPILNNLSTGPVKEARSKQAVWFPELNLYGIKDDVKHYASAAALGKSEKQIEMEWIKNAKDGRVPNYDTGLELLSKGSAEAQAEYIGAMLRVSKMSLKEMENLHLYEGDGPLLNAVLFRMNSDPEAANLLIKISDRAAANKRILQTKTEELVSSGQIASGASGPTSSYVAEIEKIKERINSTHAGNPIPSDYNANELVNNWIGGDKLALQRLVADWNGSQHGGFARAGLDKGKAARFDAIYNSYESKQIREELSKLADADGNIFLYRGWQTDKISGHGILDSYALSAEKAGQFTKSYSGPYAGVKLYKVPVEDVVAAFKDIGPNTMDNAELIVKASARPVQAEYDKFGKILNVSTSPAGTVVKTTIQTTEEIATASTKFGKDDIEKLFVAAKEDAIQTLIANGLPLDSIALKTNTPIKIVESYVADNNLLSASAGLVPPSNFNQIKSLEDITSTLAPKNQPYVLSGNLRKPQYITSLAGLNNKTLANIDSEFKRVIMMQSKSQVSTEMATFLDSYSSYIGILKSQLGNVNNQVSGNRFFNSFDHWSKDMKQAGMIGSVFGKEFQNIGNRAMNKILEPVKSLMSSVAKDEAAIIEFNNAMNINASLSKWRSFGEDGKLYQKVTKVGEDGKPITTLEAVKNTNGSDFQIVTQSVKDLVRGIQAQSPELRNLANTIKKIQGSPDVNDIGFWVPSFNPVNKFIAYVHNEAEDTVKMLWGRNAAEFEESVTSYKKYLLETGSKDKIYKKGEQDFWNILNDRLDVINMKRADIGLEKSGKTSGAVVKSDLTIFGEIVGGYEHYVSSQVRNLADLALSDITDSLRKMSSLNTLNVSNQPLDKIKAVLSRPEDAARTFHNALLGNTNLEEYAGWQAVNRSFETGLNLASNAISSVIKTATVPLGIFKKDGSINSEQLKKINYEKINEELKKRGIQNPYEAFESEAATMFAMSKLADSQDQAKRIVYSSNALIATAALRFGEIAQPLVNMLSMPILTSLAIGDRMPSTFLGVQRATKIVAPMEVMHEGIRAMNSPVFAALNKSWEKAGYFTPLVSEVSDLMRASRQFEKGIITKIENALDSKFVQLAAKSADYAESLTRKAAMNVGAQVAKRLYPELDDLGITIFARDFMDKAIGNFNAAQRPVFFQGTLGAALGLFQTYSLTLGQSIYRHLELKNFKELGKAALLQSTLFGTKSLPGFDLVSNAIGEHYSEEHFDFETGTYRAIKDPAARWALYGLPSNLGPSISSRGDADPRLPIVTDMVAYNFAKQTGAMFGEIKRALDSDAPQMGRALAQALSLQSMSRPLARTAELATGYSITKAGNTVQIPEEVWTPTGIISRMMATRPIEEQQLRDMDHLNRFYGAIDRKNRHEVIETLRTAVRDGSLDDSLLSKTADKYLKAGGSPTGWRSAVNTAIAKTETSGRETFIQRLKPNSPFMHMMDSLDGE